MAEPRAFELPYGHGSISAGVAGESIAPRRAAPEPGEMGAVERAIAQPIGTPPLREVVRPSERVAIVVNDITRLTRTDLLLPPILRTLNEAGIPDSQIFIVFALGIPRPQSDAQRRQIVGDAIFGRIRTFDHLSTDAANLVTVGTTSFGNVVEINRQVWETDRIILTGEIIYHLIAGYSGGRKSLVPGVAGYRTTTFNHSMIFDPRCRPGLLDGNPAHEDLLEACRMVEPDFLVNVVLSPQGELIRVVAGHFDLAHREGCRTVDSMLRVDLDEPFDAIIASAGGFPIDIDLRQAHKGLENACLALKRGGTILFYAKCPAGAGIQSFEDYIYCYDGDRAMEAALRQDFVVGGHKAWWVARLGRLYDVRLVSGLDPVFVKRCGFQPVSLRDHEQAISRLLSEVPRSARIAVMPYSGFTLPVVRAASGAHP
jgi:nickel-dependent lactate racemase